MTVLTAPETLIKRDRYGRPLVIPPGGGRPKPYTRATTLAGTLDDTYNLSRWQQRMVAIGLADRPDYLLAVTAHRDDKTRLNGICEDAIEAAKGGAAATTGTALHALTELVDRGLDIPVVPEATTRALNAYREAMRPFEVVAIEQFTVLDDLEVGGTPDRIVRYGDRTLIADIKTGSIEWSIQKIAIQLALYSRGVGYDPKTGERFDLPPVDQRNGLIIHLPADDGRCDLHWVNLDAGWQAAQLAVAVREWRKANGLTVPFAS